MQDLNSRAWLDYAKSIDSPEVEVQFITKESYYFGDPNDWAQLQSGDFMEPLYQPNLDEDSNGWLLSKVVGSNVQELVDYYLDVLRLHRKHGNRPEAGDTYFWIRPVFLLSRDRPITFPIYDTWKEALYLFDSLTGLEDNEVFDDIDQGWRFEAFRSGDLLYLRDSDWEQDIEHSVVKFSRSELVEKIAITRERVAKILDDLKSRVGGDYWSESVLRI